MSAQAEGEEVRLGELARRSAIGNIGRPGRSEVHVQRLHHVLEFRLDGPIFALEPLGFQSLRVFGQRMRAAHADEIRRLDVARPERPIEELAVFRRCDLGHLHLGRRDKGTEVAHRVVRTGQRATVHRGKIAERLSLGKSRDERRRRTEDGLHIRFVPFLQIPFDEAIARGGHGSQSDRTGVIPTRIGRALASADLHRSGTAWNNQRFEFVLPRGQPVDRGVARQRNGHTSALS